MICENETNCFTNCGYWQYQQIAIKKLENFTFQSCILWVLNLWQQKRNAKWSTNSSTNVSNLESEVAKWSGVSPALSWRFFSLCKPQKLRWFNTTSRGYYRYSIFKLNQYCTLNKNPKIKIAAIYGHFRYFQSFTTVFTKMTND